jgi:hypothetical protein
VIGVLRSLAWHKQPWRRCRRTSASRRERLLVRHAIDLADTIDRRRIHGWVGVEQQPIKLHGRPTSEINKLKLDWHFAERVQMNVKPNDTELQAVRRSDFAILPFTCLRRLELPDFPHFAELNSLIGILARALHGS